MVIGGSGNGEQIAANKVTGCRAALAYNTETAKLAREHNDAQVVGIGARMHSPAEAAGIVDTFLATPFSGVERHARRIRMLEEYERTGVPPRPAELVPEGHTLHRLARLHKKLFAGRPVEVSSPQGRFVTAASVVDGRVLRRAEAYGKHLFHVYGPDAIVHVHLGLIGTFSEQPLPVTPPVGQVRMRMVGETHFTDLRGPTVLRADRRRADERACWPSWARTRCAATPTRRGPGRGCRGRGCRSRRC